VTALAASGPLLFAAEGPFLRYYICADNNFKYISTTRVFQAQSIHGISTRFKNSDHGLASVLLVCWGGRLVRTFEINFEVDSTANRLVKFHRRFYSAVLKMSDWIFCLSWGPEDTSTHRVGVCAAVTAHNALLELTIERQVEHDLLDGYYSPFIFLSVCFILPEIRIHGFESEAIMERS